MYKAFISFNFFVCVLIYTAFDANFNQDMKLAQLLESSIFNL